MVLDNESWMTIPLRADFSVKSIEEQRLGSQGPSSIVDATSAHNCPHNQGEWAARGNIFAMNNCNEGTDVEAVEAEEENNAHLLAGVGVPITLLK